MELKANPGRCEDASALSGEKYIPCNAPATAVIAWVKRGEGPYRMCAEHAHHSVRNRGADLLGAYPDALPTTYTGSDGKATPIGDLNPTRAINAAKKLRASGGDLLLVKALEDGADESARAFLAKTPDYVPKTAPPATNRPALERADGSATTSKDNRPPDDPFLAQLEEDHAALVNEVANHDIAASDLPKVVESDEDVAKINAWVTTARALNRKAETERVEANAPLLVRKKKLDGFFKGLGDLLLDRAKTIEQRNAPYLSAKRAREAAEREAAAAEARRQQAIKDEEARQAQARADEARRLAAEAEQRIREAEGAEARRVAEQQAREAAQVAQAAKKDAVAAGKESIKADNAADKADRQADPERQRGLERTAAGGGSAKLKMVLKYRIDDKEAVQASLGVWRGFIGSNDVYAALERAARADPWPEIPGVAFFEEEEVLTTATH